MCNGGLPKHKLKSFLRCLSLGKYRTPLYYKNDDNYSTITSGLISLIVIVGMIVFTVLTMVPIFQKSSYQLERTSKLLNMYNNIGGGKFIDSTDPLNYTLTINKALELFNNIEYRIYGNITASPEYPLNCYENYSFFLLINTSFYDEVGPKNNAI